MSRNYHLPIVILILMATGCGMLNWASVGPMNNESYSFEKGTVEKVKATLTFNVGELQISSGTEKLMAADFQYNVKKWKPELSLDDSGSPAQITLKQPDAKTFSGNAKNRWQVQFNQEIPIHLTITTGVGESKIDVSQLNIEKVEATSGVGEMSLDLRGTWDHDVRVNVSAGIGETSLLLPKEMPVKVYAKVGIGELNLQGLHKNGNSTYVNEVYQEGQPALHVNVNGGIGEISLEVKDSPIPKPVVLEMKEAGSLNPVDEINKNQ